MEEEMSKDETPKKPNPKIDCKCRRSVLTLLRLVEEHIKNVFSQNDILAVTGNALAEAYKEALLSNILIEGKTLKGDDLSDLDTTTEFEPFDTSKEHHIMHVLMDRFDRQIVSTTRLRKSASKQVRRKMKQLIKPELKYSALVTVQSSERKKDIETQSGDEAMETQSGDKAMETLSGGEEAMNTGTSISSGTVTLEEIQTRVERAGEKCSFVQQHCTDMLQKATDLSQAVQILKQSEKSEMAKVVYETPPSSFGRTTLNKDLQATKQISKKLLI